MKSPLHSVATLLSYLIVAACIGSLLACFYDRAWAAQGVVLALVLAALRLPFSSEWSTYAFTFWVMAVVLQAFCTPSWFLDWPTGPANAQVPLLIQIIMFGMGTTLTLNDFARVLLVPKSVGVGMLLQFTVMPLTGWALANALPFPPEIAVGLILIGSCPGGVASNVITYLARGDVALSVTMTACSTLMSPIMTPLCMSLLSSSSVSVSFIDLMWNILNMTIAPVVLGLIASYALTALRWNGPWLERLLSSIAIAAICVVIGIIVAQSRSELLSVGLALFLAAMVHNAVGYCLGYFGARACKLDETTCRTISIEVGMQNGGMASALAIKVLEIPQAAIAGAFFGAWMSISGSILASWWRARMPAPVPALMPTQGRGDDDIGGAT